MVVKASTKPWPRQLGSSIIRALPPQGHCGHAMRRVVPIRYILHAMRAGGRQYDAQIPTRSLRRPLISLSCRPGRLPRRLRLPVALRPLPLRRFPPIRAPVVVCRDDYKEAEGQGLASICNQSCNRLNFIRKQFVLSM